MCKCICILLCILIYLFFHVCLSFVLSPSMKPEIRHTYHTITNITLIIITTIIVMKSNNYHFECTPSFSFISIYYHKTNSLFYVYFVVYVGILVYERRVDRVH